MQRSTLLLLLLVGIPTVTLAQGSPALYTYSAHWEVPRENWAEFTADNGSIDLLNRLVDDGTLVAWGNDAAFVHTEDGTTHGNWFSATSLRGIEHALEELVKLPAGSAFSGVKHHDHLSRSLMQNGRTARGVSGYMWVDIVQVEPNQGRRWLALQKKHFQPMFEKLLADGTILAYSCDREWVHRANPRTRTISYIVPDADALDKVDAAYQALYEREGDSLFAGLGATAVRARHRDVLLHVTEFTHK